MMREYAQWQTATLLRRLGKEASKTSRSSGADAVHDLRVAIRRMKGCLGLFADFYPNSRRKELKKELTKLMDACGEVRDRDIALEMLADAGAPAASAVVRRLTAEREDASRELRNTLKDWKAGRFAREWRTRLRL
jgi:CHAD domain-containing protein